MVNNLPARFRWSKGGKERKISWVLGNRKTQTSWYGKLSCTLSTKNLNGKTLYPDDSLHIYLYNGLTLIKDWNILDQLKREESGFMIWAQVYIERRISKLC